MKKLVTRELLLPIGQGLPDFDHKTIVPNQKFEDVLNNIDVLESLSSFDISSGWHTEINKLLQIGLLVPLPSRDSKIPVPTVKQQNPVSKGKAKKFTRLNEGQNESEEKEKVSGVNEQGLSTRKQAKRSNRKNVQRALQVNKKQEKKKHKH